MRRAIIFILSILLFSSFTSSRVEELEAKNEALKNELIILRAERDVAQQEAEVQMILALHQTEISRAVTEQAMLSMKRAEEFARKEMVETMRRAGASEKEIQEVIDALAN